MGQRTGECVYCGTTQPLTEDHIPPQALFTRPLPSDLVKVPSCAHCNEGSSRDDEYFRAMLVMKDRVGDHPETTGPREALFRSLDNPRKWGFRQHIARISRPVNLRSRAGLHLGRWYAYDVDLHRLDRVAARVIRGLFWRHHGRRLSESHEVEAYSEAGFVDADPEWLTQFKRTILAPISKRPLHSIGRGVLSYRYAPIEGMPDGTAWILEFYGDVRFVVVTLPKVRPAGRTSSAIAE